MEKYIMVYSTDRAFFLKQVNSFIKDGYIPQGGSSVCIVKGSETFTQAMVLPEVLNNPQKQEHE